MMSASPAAVARSSVAIYERLDSGGDVLSTENILDGVAIATAFIGVGGSLLRSHGIKAVKPVAFRAGNWMIMSTVAADVGTFLYASAEAIAAFRAIQADPTLDDSQKLMALLRIMSSLFLNGTLLIVTNRELFKSGFRPTDFIKSKVTGDTKPELDVGTRLDVEYELKQGKMWDKDTSKLSDEEVLNKLFQLRSRKEAETRIAALRETLNPDGKAELDRLLGEGSVEDVWRKLESQPDPKKFLEESGKLHRDSPLFMSREQLASNRAAQEKLFEMAKQMRDDMDALAAKLEKDLKLDDAEHTAIVKREDFDEFVAGVLDKMKRKKYSRAGQMDDMARGRFNLKTWDDVRKMVGALEQTSGYTVRVQDPQPRVGVAKGYPRFHVIMKDPKTGMTFEWQVGTRATTTVFEHPGIPLPPGFELKKGMKPDIHDIEYDIFKAVQDKHPDLAKELGIPEFRKKVAVLAERSALEAGQPGKTDDYWKGEIAKLHAEAGRILQSLVDKKGASWVKSFFH